MIDINTLVSILCVVLVLGGLVMIYVLSEIRKDFERRVSRTERRMGDTAFYMSKVEEGIEDSTNQLDKKADRTELEKLVRETAYEVAFASVKKNRAIRNG